MRAPWSRPALLIGLIVLTGCGGAARHRANMAIVRGYLEEVLNRGDTAAIARYFPAEGFRFNGNLVRHADVPRWRQALLARYPDFHIAVEDQIAQGDKVVTRVTFSGTHLGVAYGVAPTGRRVSYQGIAIDRIVGGKVVEGWHQADDLGLLRQLGVTRVP